MKKLLSLLLLFFVLVACEDKQDMEDIFDDMGWSDPSDKQDPTEGKRCFIWIEGNANFKDYGDSRENIARDMAKIADCGFTDIVVDVRPAGAGGDVLYKTDKCDQVQYMGAWINGEYVKVERHSDWDYLQAFIKHGVNSLVRFELFQFYSANALNKPSVIRHKTPHRRKRPHDADIHRNCNR